MEKNKYFDKNTHCIQYMIQRITFSGQKVLICTGVTVVVKTQVVDEGTGW